MLSSVDLERLIAEKRSEIEREKILLGLTPADKDDKENIVQDAKRQVNFTGHILGDHNEQHREDKEQQEKTLQDLEEKIPPDLERYIRRYLGLPVMLKAGEYSPNNPLIRSERATGDALLGLGEYERRRNTLRKIRQQQYREYLDQQAKKKQEAKEQAEKERKEREERERLQEEREREREQRQRSPEVRRASYAYSNEYLNNGSRGLNRVDTGVQVSGVTRPLSVAVQTDQTDDTQIFRLPPSRGTLTEAERELSPRAAREERPQQRAGALPCYAPTDVRRRSYGDFADEYKPRAIRGSTHSWMPSIFDADAIQLRNQHAEKEAAARRQFYQQELKNQILEQQRIRDERKAREMMLEQAEMRRLEEQLRALRGAQEVERDNQRALLHTAKQNAIEYDNKRKSLQKDIEDEKKNLLRVTSLPATLKRNQTSHSDTQLPSKLPFYYPRGENTNPERPPYSINIPENSIFSPNYDVESYLRKNLNPSKESLKTKFETNYENKYDLDYKYDKEFNNDLVNKKIDVKINKLPNIEQKIVKDVDTLPIPVLRHSPKTNKVDATIENDLSDAMKMVDDKWKVPAVQKNILKSQSSDGKNISILTQLGSIRRQLQLEQLKLDQMVGKQSE